MKLRTKLIIAFVVVMIFPVTFALIVHTIQTSLTALLGVYAILALQGRKIRKEIKEQTGQPFNK